MAEISLNVAKREPSTKGTLNQLRREGYIPGTFYVKGKDPISFTTTVNGVKPLVYTAENHIINFSVDDVEVSQAILKDVQFDPVSEQVMHIDLLGLTKGQEVVIQVPVVHTGYAKGVKAGGLLTTHLHKLEVKCLPRDIPEHLTIDITELRVGQAIRVRDLSFENMTIVSAPNLAVVSVGRSRTMTDEDVAAAKAEAADAPATEEAGSEE